MMKLVFVVLALLLLVNPASAFSAPAGGRANEAVAFFDSKYPFGRPSGDSPRFSDISEARARQAFGELSKLYGDEEALDMVKALPVILCFDCEEWQGSLDAWEEIFGKEQAMGMVGRNPGLLAVSAYQAAATEDSAMVFSYIIAATRPFGNILLPGLLFCLLTPAIEAVTGIPVRSAFLDIFQ